MSIRTLGEHATRRSAFLLLLLAPALAGASAAAVEPKASRASAVCSSVGGAAIALTIAVPRTPMHVVDSGSRLWIALAGDHDPRTGATLAGGSIVSVDRDTGRILRTLHLPVDPTQFAAAFGSLWVIGAPTSRRYNGVVRVDPHTGRVIAVIRASRAYGSRITATSKAVWVGGADVFAKGRSDQAGVRFVYKIDPQQDAVVRQVRLPRGMTVLDLEPEGSTLWVSGWWGVARISDSGRTLFHAPFAGAGWSMAATPRAVWVALPWSGMPYQRRQDAAHISRRLLRIDRGSRTPRVTAIDLPGQPGGVAASGDTVWMGGSQGLARVDDTNAPPVVAPTGVDVRATDFAPFPGGTWVAEAAGKRVTKVVC